MQFTLRGPAAEAGPPSGGEGGRHQGPGRAPPAEAADGLCFLTARELATLVARRALSPVEIVEAHLRRIESVEGLTNAFITLQADEALGAARQAEGEIAAGSYRGPLHGIPYAVKDLFHTRGLRTTFGSRLYQDFVPPQDATLIARLRRAGAILLGKANLSHLGLGATGDNPDYGAARNPWNPKRMAGGSSSGSAAACAAGECTFALGTDTGGSVRMPASFCSLVGLKPTRGLLSRHGALPCVWSMDSPGPMTRSVEDCALVLGAVAGHDPRDPSSADRPVPDYSGSLQASLEGLRVGVPEEFLHAPLQPDVARLTRSALETLSELGAEVTEIRWTSLHLCEGISALLQAETACHLGQMLHDHAAHLDPDLGQRLERLAAIPAVAYLRAQRLRSLVLQESLELFERIDLLAGPTMAMTAPPFGVESLQIGDRAVTLRPLYALFCRPFNLTGFPAVTVPAGFDSDGLPVGLQLAARPFEEGTLLRAAYTYQEATEWHRRHPAL